MRYTRHEPDGVRFHPARNPRLLGALGGLLSAVLTRTTHGDPAKRRGCAKNPATATVAHRYSRRGERPAAEPRTDPAPLSQSDSPAA
jgi:hypothetical protein